MTKARADDATRTVTAAARPRDERAGPRLVAVWTDGSLILPLTPGAALTVGRGDDADVHIAHPSMSRLHARLEMGPPVRWTDLGSFNGTWVDGRRLGQGERAELPHGAVAELGSVLVIVEPGASSPTPPRAPRGRDVVVVDAATVAVYRQIELVAQSHLNVLLLGESGVGKELLAAHVHAASRRAAGPMVKVNCAALVDTLLEAELFGYEKGAFTGATHAKIGLLESASGGTFFLDEVGDLPAATQTKLLRVLEANEVQPVGALKPRPLDVRYVSATNRDLRKLVASGAFREDLFFRLDGFSLRVPPLRDRIGDVPPLVEAFVADTCARAGRPPPRIAEDAMARLLSYPWPGNVRELRNVVARSVVMSAADTLHAADLLFDAEGGSPATARTLKEVPAAGGDAAAREAILRALAESAGNQKRAAEILGVSRRTLQYRLDALKIPRPRKG